MIRAILGLSMCLVLPQGFAEEAFTVSGEYTHVEKIGANRHTYMIEVGGTADMDNTATRTHGDWDIAFQNNVSVVIANTGVMAVANPKLVTNDKRRWFSNEAMLEEFTQGAKDDQERIYLIYEGLRQNRHHDYPLFADDEYHDPVRFLNIYGGGFCDDSGKCGSALYYLAGFNRAQGGKDPFVRALHGHMMCEVWHDGDFQWIDIDQDTFFLDRENRKPISGDRATHDHDYAKREQVYGPLFQPWDGGPHSNASLFGMDDDRTRYGVLGHKMDYTLRPGERIEFRWDNMGKYPWKRQDVEHRYYGNSRLVYEPLKADEAAALKMGKGFRRDGESVVAEEEQFRLLLTTQTPYAVCGAALRFDWDGLPASGALRVGLEKGGGEFKTAWEVTGETRGKARIPLDGVLGVAGGPLCRDYGVSVAGQGAAGVRLSKLVLETDLYAYPIALPRLSVGKNSIEYTDDAADSHKVTITYSWRESDNVAPPKPPETPEAPGPGATVHATRVPFSWPAVEGCNAYHLRVSRDPNLRYAYRPNYDLVLPENAYEVPYRGMFSTGETYYWRVRPRLACGLWGDWSPTWTFAWAGPMVPTNVRAELQGEALWLRWDANTRGARPVAYDVYGSDEKGFSVHHEPHELPVLGQVGSNFVGRTQETALLVGGPDAAGGNTNKGFYRVVAVDEAGVESCPSDYAELPRPHVYTRPMVEAKAGEVYTYQIRTISSIGDLQSRYIDPGKAYREREVYCFSLVEGPAWLEIDPESGLLSGTPTTADRGRVSVAVDLKTEYPFEVPVDSKSGESFQKKGRKFKRKCMQQFALQVR